MKRNAALLVLPALIAFNATSTNFYVRQALVETAGGNATSSVSSSATYTLLSAGGQTAPGTSTTASFSVGAGILNALFVRPNPSYEQTHFHWRNDDGSEAAATSATGGAQDTTLASLSKNTGVRLRIALSNEGGTQTASYSSLQLRLEYGLRSTTCSAIVSWTNVGDNGGDFDMSDSSNLTQGGNTTNIAVAAGGVSDTNAVFAGAGGVLDTASQSGALFVSSDTFYELEYSIKALTAATDGGTYCFRLTNAGSTSLFTYAAYPMATVAGDSLTLTVSTNVFPAVAPGAVVFATTTVAVSTSNVSGWSTSLSSDDRSITNTAMDLDSNPATGVTDQLEWIPGQATTSAGNAVRISSLGNSGDVLAFRAMTASGTVSFRAPSWWGTTDSYVDAATTFWAGLASSTVQRQIGNSSVSSGGGTALNTVLYYLKVPITQPNGSYTAPLTVTAVANP